MNSKRCITKKKQNNNKKKQTFIRKGDGTGLYISPQYHANLNQTIGDKGSHTFAIIFPELTMLCMLDLKMLEIFRTIL